MVCNGDQTEINRLPGMEPDQFRISILFDIEQYQPRYKTEEVGKAAC